MLFYQISLVVLAFLLDLVGAQNVNIATQCRLVPSAGRCTDTRREFWSYSSKTGGCVRLIGCYSIQDRNVFLTKAGCENACYMTGGNADMPAIIPGVPGVTISLECRMNPSAGQCRQSEVRRYWTYSSKSGSCTQVTGCYSITDRNIWLTREGCQRGCFARSGSPATPRPNPGPNPTMPPITVPKTTPRSPQVALGCRVTPSAGVCRPQDKKTYYSYSSKTNSCEQIFGCFTLRDRNVFLTIEGCQRSCFGSGNSGEWTMSSQCFMNAQPGQCTRQGRFYTYSSKLSDCTQIFGCYGVRDRNVFLSLEGCRKACVGNSSGNPLPDVKPNVKLALECRITPNGGVCRENEKKTFFSYSGKTGDCEEIFGCFSVRDRNVFLGKAGCRRACFINKNEQVAGMAESQCYIIPSTGRCTNSKNFYSYSPKVNRCVPLTGCYSVRDRNVFLTNEGCARTCAGNATNEALDPEYAGMDVDAGCMLNPSPGRCQANQRRNFYSYSWKAGGCINLTGCYSVRDRNVFLTRDGCRQNCYIDKSQTASTQRATECFVTPSPGRCPRNQERRYWTFSTKTNGCTEIQGCYNIRDRNVFLMQQGCERRCAVDTSITPNPLPETGLSLSIECRVNPSAGVCRENEKRSFYSYSSKTGVCEQIYGCYSVRDRNVFLTRDGCRQNCFINSTNQGGGKLETQCYMSPSPGRCLESQKQSYWTYSTKTSGCGQIYGCYSVRDRNVFLNKESCDRSCRSTMNGTEPAPDLAGLDLTVSCRMNPAPGQCREDQKRTYYTYSGKTGTCVQIKGCYTLADRNIFLTREGCYNGCFFNRTNPPSGNTNIECFISPVVGRCPDVDRRTYYSFSSKTNDCVSIYGCYNLRDRNVFLSRDGCRYNCGVEPLDSTSRLQVEENFVTLSESSSVPQECKMMPAPGECPARQKKTYYVFSSKTGTCVSITGCYTLRDRNVFLNKESCDRRCFSNDTSQLDTIDAQCYINPSPGRCAVNSRRRYYSFSSKTKRCEEIMGCYSVQDRNVFLRRAGCNRVCAVNTNVTIIPLPDGPDISVAVECLMNPAVGQCRESQKKTYYSYSGKVGGCLPIYGCYSVQDRNVFYTSEGCTRSCFVNTTEVPSGNIDMQCYSNASPGRCRESDKRRYWTYSSKTRTCTSLFGCYSIRDRNVFLGKEGCDRACAVDTSLPQDLLPGEGMTLAIECRMNPSQGICSASQRRSYYSYSSSTGVCEEIYGCYSINDRNVFLTRDGCRHNCFVNASMEPSGQKDLQCYLNPSQGQCSQNQVRTFWTYSSKLGRCTTIRGCYSVRDRNVFLGREGCERACAVDTTNVLPDIPDAPVSGECLVSPVAGRCSPNQRNVFYSYSDKTRSCIQINGCYGVRDRNVFLSLEGCQRNCFQTDTDMGRNIQCYVSPSPGRCAAADRRRYYTFTAKTGNCQRLFGCYSYTDRNVFLTLEGCNNACAYDVSASTNTGTSANGIVISTSMMDRSFSGNVGGGMNEGFGMNPGITGSVMTNEGFSGNAAGGINVRMTTAGNMVDLQTSNPGSGSWGMDSTTMSTSMVDNSRFQVRSNDVSGSSFAEIDSLTDLSSTNFEPGVRITRECQLTPTPGICPANRMRTFWTFSSKTNSCTMITGCYDIHDRNTWLTQEGCVRGCLRREGDVLEPGVIPLECQLNPTPGRCPIQEENTFWMYNTKLGICVRITGCYDFHDRNVWSSEQRCETKCNVGEAGSILPEIQPGLKIDAECKINPPPGRCLDSERKTFWSFSSKTLSCMRIRGCITLRDRNTWLTREGCLRNCLVNETDISGPQTDVPFDCQLVPSPGLCLESQQSSVWTFSNKLGGCVQILGCYNFHDRNVWLSSESCQKNCHASHFGLTLPELNGYRISLECRLNPSPGRCPENMKRSFYSFSAKIGDCVPIYGCYTIKDRNVHFTREGCRRNCLIPSNDGINGGSVYPVCLAEPNRPQCSGRPDDRTDWWKYDQNAGACVRLQGCYRRGDRNVFISRQNCEDSCFREANTGNNGLSLECQLNPSPGSCRQDEIRTFWSYSSKTSRCTALTGCYSIRDRNVFVSKEKCEMTCQGRAVPNFLAAASSMGGSDNSVRGRRGRMFLTRNRQPNGNGGNSDIPGVTMIRSQESTRMGSQGDTRMGARENTRVVAQGNTRIGSRDNTRLVSTGNRRVVSQGNTRVVSNGNTRIVSQRNRVIGSGSRGNMDPTIVPAREFQSNEFSSSRVLTNLF